VSESAEGRRATSTDEAPAEPTVVAGTEALPARPLYGEYATPEEQRARIRQPDATWALETGQAVVPGPAETARPVATAPVRQSAGVPTRSAPRRGGLADRVITIGLLAYWLVAVLSAFAAFTDFPAFADMWMENVGIEGEFTNLAQGRLWGTIAAAAFAILWLVAAVISWRMLRRGRITFWVPLVGGVLSYLMIIVMLLVPLLGDPAIADHLLSLQR